MTLLLQLHGDLPELFPNHERRLYIFACRRKTCRRKEGSIRVIRSGRVAGILTPAAESKSPHDRVPSQRPGTAQSNDVGNSLFGINKLANIAGTANPFYTSSEINVNPFSSKTLPSVCAIPNSLPSSSETLATKPHQAPVTDDLHTSFAQKARFSSPSPSIERLVTVEPWPSEAELPPAYPVYHLDADYETLDAPKKSAKALQSVDANEIDFVSSPSAGTPEDSEVFESTIDKTFQSFADRLAQNPQQVLRYQFGGLPLLYSKADAVGARLVSFQSSSHPSNSKISVANKTRNSGIPICANCGSSRVFELQLTPQAIYELEIDEMGLEGMDWGTIIVGVCGNDCQAKDVEVGQVGYLEEWVGVQWEERGVTRR